jgi:hypothetical protein
MYTKKMLFPLFGWTSVGWILESLKQYRTKQKILFLLFWEEERRMRSSSRQKTKRTRLRFDSKKISTVDAIQDGFQVVYTSNLSDVAKPRGFNTSSKQCQTRQETLFLVVGSGKEDEIVKKPKEEDSGSKP